MACESCSGSGFDMGVLEDGDKEGLVNKMGRHGKGKGIRKLGLSRSIRKQKRHEQARKRLRKRSAKNE